MCSSDLSVPGVLKTTKDSGSVKNVAGPNPITPMANISIMDSSAPLIHNEIKGKSEHDPISLAGSGIPPAEDAGKDVSECVSKNEDGSFEEANNQFHEDIGKLNDIQNHGIADLVNVRVQLCTLESLILSLHSSFDDVSDETQLLLSDAHEFLTVQF